MSAIEDVATLRASFGERILGTVEFRDEQTVIVALAALPEVLAQCRHQLGY
ncbi:MAG: hypothetical protein RLZZ522_316, partial [Verrucomicrobiota bacterium]